MLNTLTDELISLIKQDAYFENINVIAAYPNSAKPTRISKAYVTVGIDEINMKSNQLDSPQRAGEVCIFADIFTPLRSNDGYTAEIFSNLCRVLECYNVLSVSAQRATADNSLQANVQKTVITFSGVLDFGGEADE